MAILEITNLRKTYGSTVAVDDVSFSVEEGEIFGILGPNGAGKTTTVECVEGLRRRDGGEIRVLGHDPDQDHAALTRVVGVQLQESGLQDRIRVREALDLFATFYDDPVPADELLDELQLADVANSAYGKLSGGQKQRLSIALALLGRPRIAVLDELTTGLDPMGRRDTWALVERIRERGVTVLLVTHFMEEAERLCDRVAVIDHGRVVALDTPGGIIGRMGGEQVLRFRLARTARPPAAHRPAGGPGRALARVRLRRHRQHRDGPGGAVDAHPRRDPRARREARPGVARRRLRRPRPRGPGRRHERGGPRMTALIALTRNEFRLLVREPLYLFWGLVFPVILLVVLGSIPSFREVNPDLGGVTLISTYTPVIIVLSITFTSVAGLPTVIGTYRERLILKRLATTPVGSARLLAALMVQNLITSLAMTVLVVLVARLGFGVALPGAPVAWLLTLVLIAAALLSLGLAVAALSPNGKIAGAVGNILFFPLMFFAGLWIPLPVMPELLRRIGELTPLGAGVEALQEAAAGQWPDAGHLVVLVAYVVVLSAGAVRVFRWT